MSDSYYNRDYNLNPKIREMIEKRMGKIYDLSYVQVENVISNIFKGVINTEKKYTDNDKEKLISILEETSPNRMNEENIDNVVKFCQVSFTDDDFRKYVDYCIRKYYKPGMIYNGVKIFNGGVTEIAKKSNLYNVKQGFILNKDYANDLLPLFDNDETKIDYDEKSLMVNDDYTDFITNFFDEIKNNYDIEYFNTPELFIVACNNDETVTYLKDKYGFKIENVLDFSYYEIKDEEETDEMQLAPGIVMKGNFSKLGKIGGTEVIGVGSSSGNSLLDKLAADDAMNKLKKILGQSTDDDDDDDDDDSGNDDDGDNTGKSSNGNGGNGGDSKIDCNDPNYPNRSVLERIFASKEWKEGKYMPKELKTPDGWGYSETMYSDLDDSDELLSNPKNWLKEHSWDSCFVHPEAESFQGQKVNAFYYVVTGSTDRDINVFMVDDIIIGWYYHED